MRVWWGDFSSLFGVWDLQFSVSELSVLCVWGLGFYEKGEVSVLCTAQPFLTEVRWIGPAPG